MISRTKSKSGWDAEGKPTSISLKPISTRWREHDALALKVHRVDQGLVAVAQVDAAPARGSGQSPVGPGAVGQPTGTVSRYFANAMGLGCWGPEPHLNPFVIAREKKKCPRIRGGQGEHRLAPLQQQFALDYVTYHCTSASRDVQSPRALT